MSDVNGKVWESRRARSYPVGQAEVDTIDRFHRTVIRTAIWVFPIVFALEWVPELIQGKTTHLPRWWMYLVFWVPAVVLSRLDRPNALILLMPGIGYLSLNTTLESIYGGNFGAPEPATALGVLVGLSIVATALARRRFWLTVVTLTAAVCTVGWITGVQQDLELDALTIRVVGLGMVIVLASWLIRRLQNEQTATAEELADALKGRDALVAAVSHELRTPLTGIVGLSEELVARGDELQPDQVSEFTRLIAEQSREMSFIIDDLLVASRLEAGALVVVPEVIDLSAVAEQAVRSAGIASTSSGKDVAVSGDRAWTVADPLRCRQVIRNLVSNAIRYGGNSVSVVVGSSQEEAYVRVVDDGSALSAADLERVFEPYQRASGPAQAPASVGLGLAVSRDLARLMGGDVFAAATGGETSFVFSLPVANEGQPAAKPAVSGLHS